MLHLMSNIRSDIPYLVPVSLMGGLLNTMVTGAITLTLTSTLLCCTRATCLIVSRLLWQYNSCYYFVDMLQKRKGYDECEPERFDLDRT